MVFTCKYIGGSYLLYSNSGLGTIKIQKIYVIKAVCFSDSDIFFSQVFSGRIKIKKCPFVYDVSMLKLGSP